MVLRLVKSCMWIWRAAVGMSWLWSWSIQVQAGWVAVSRFLENGKGGKNVVGGWMGD